MIIVANIIGKHIQSWFIRFLKLKPHCTTFCNIYYAPNKRLLILQKYRRRDSVCRLLHHEDPLLLHHEDPLLHPLPDHLLLLLLPPLLLPRPHHIVPRPRLPLPIAALRIQRAPSPAAWCENGKHSLLLLSPWVGWCSGSGDRDSTNVDPLTHRLLCEFLVAVYEFPQSRCHAREVPGPGRELSCA